MHLERQLAQIAQMLRHLNIWVVQPVVLHAREPVEAWKLELPNGEVDLWELLRFEHSSRKVHVRRRCDHEGQFLNVWQDNLLPLLWVIGIECDAIQKRRLVGIRIGSPTLCCNVDLERACYLVRQNNAQFACLVNSYRRQDDLLSLAWLSLCFLPDQLVLVVLNLGPGFDLPP